MEKNTPARVYSNFHVDINRMQFVQSSRPIMPSSVYLTKYSVAHKLRRFLVPARRHSVIAITAAHFLAHVSQIQGLDLDCRGSGLVAHLWTKFYLHVGRAIQELSNDLSNDSSVLNNEILTTILLVMSADVSLIICCHFPKLTIISELHGRVLSNIRSRPRFLDHDSATRWSSETSVVQRRRRICTPWFHTVCCNFSPNSPGPGNEQLIFYWYVLV